MASSKDPWVYCHLANDDRLYAASNGGLHTWVGVAEGVEGIEVMTQDEVVVVANRRVAQYHPQLLGTACDVCGYFRCECRKEQ